MLFSLYSFISVHILNLFAIILIEILCHYFEINYKDYINETLVKNMIGTCRYLGFATDQVQRNRCINPSIFAIVWIILLIVIPIPDLFGESDVQKKDSIKQTVWESKLFPKKNGQYTFAEINGFKLPDFSYAGYHCGEKSIPNPTVKLKIKPVEGNNTSHIQEAINKSIGGALLLLPGIYRVTNEIIIPSHTVLKGSGPDKTYILVDMDSTRMTSILVGNRSQKSIPKINYWRPFKGNKKVNIVGDVQKNTDIIHLENVNGLAKGDWIVIKNEVTDDFRMDYNGITEIKGKKIWPTDQSSIKYFRRIKRISKKHIIIDRPIQHILKFRDNPQVLKTPYMAEEIGIENLSIGYKTPANLEKYVGVNGKKTPFHNSSAIKFGNVVNGWIKNVHTYSPSNTGIHIHSKGIVIQNSARITVLNCDFGYPPPTLRLGGNGYIFVLTTSNDCLIKQCTSRAGRHNFHFGYGSSGNVVTRSRSLDCKARNDFHHSLSIANLIETMQFTCNSEKKEAFITGDRGRASLGAGYTGLDNTFWNLSILTSGKAIVSKQANANGGKGYIIGVTSVGGSLTTQGSEWREGIGHENGLRPFSLYDEQLKQRLEKR